LEIQPADLEENYTESAMIMHVTADIWFPVALITASKYKIDHWGESWRFVVVLYPVLEWL
jgi:hypothetical protein